jgi:peptidyl-prolyl cis-trans isomerase SurA
MMARPSSFVPLRKARAFLAAALAACVLLAAGSVATAQVVLLVNGAPITESDIAQRTKLFQLSANKTPSRKEVIDDLTNDHLKISIAKRYGMEISDADVNNSFAGMAQRSRVTPAQFEQTLMSRGVSPNNFKLRIRAELGWGALVRGRFTASMQVGEADIRDALKSRGPEEAGDQSYIYTIYPVIFVGAQGSDPESAARRKEAESLRARFNSCSEDLRVARAMRNVVVKEPILRNSADLSPQLREMLDKIEIGKLTGPEITAQGVQMFAVCDRKVTNTDSPAKRKIREELAGKKFETESKKWLDELRRQALIEYRQPQ